MAFDKTSFYAHSLNQFAPNRIRGEYLDWGLNAQVMEVEIDSTQSATLYAGDPVAIVSTSTGKLKVVAATASDHVYGYILYNPKHETYKAGDIVSVLRDGGVISEATTEAINAGTVVYMVPSTGEITATSTSNIKVGIALEKSASSTDGTLIAVEVIRQAI